MKEVKNYLDYLIRQLAAPEANDFPVDPRLLKEANYYLEMSALVAYKLAHKYGLYGAKLAFLVCKLEKLKFEDLKSLFQNPSMIEYSLSGLKSVGFGESWQAFVQGRHDFSSEGANALFLAIDELQEADLTEKINLKEWLALWGRHLCNIRRETVRALARRCLAIFRKIRRCDAELWERIIGECLAEVKKIIPSFELSDVFVGGVYGSLTHDEMTKLRTRVPELLGALLFPVNVQYRSIYSHYNHFSYINTSAEAFLDWIEKLESEIYPPLREYMEKSMFVEPIIYPAYSNYLYKSILQNIEEHKQGHHTGYSFIFQGTGSGKTKTVLDLGSRCILLTWPHASFYGSNFLLYIFATFTVLQRWLGNPRTLNSIYRWYPISRINFLKALSNLQADKLGGMGSDFGYEVKSVFNETRSELEHNGDWFEKIRIIIGQVKEMLRPFPGVPSGDLPVIFFFDDFDGCAGSFPEPYLGSLTITAEAFKGLGHFILAGNNIATVKACAAFNIASGEKREFGLYTDLPYVGQIPMETKNLRAQPSVIADPGGNTSLHYYPLDCVSVGRPLFAVLCNGDGALGSYECLSHIVKQVKGLSDKDRYQAILSCVLGDPLKKSQASTESIDHTVVDFISEDMQVYHVRYPTEPVIADAITRSFKDHFIHVDQLLNKKIVEGEMFNIMKGMRGAHLAGYSFLMAKLLLDRNELHSTPRSLSSILIEMFRAAKEANIPNGFIAFNAIRRCTVAVTKEVLYEAWRRRVLLHIDSTELIIPMIVAKGGSQEAVASAENATGVVIKVIDTCIAPFSQNGTPVDEEFRKVALRAIESIKSRGFAPILLLIAAGCFVTIPWPEVQYMEECTVIASHCRDLFKSVRGSNTGVYHDEKYHWSSRMAPTNRIRIQFDCLGKEATNVSQRIMTNWGMYQSL